MNSSAEMKLFALVVTYRNPGSLKKCIDRLLLQSDYIHKIVVVNNASKDVTESYLESIKEKVECIHLKTNTGGAGGYHYGLKYCVEKGADWIWCVEDDILSSRNFAMEFKKLFSDKQEDLENIGFFYPRVISIMNRHKLDGNVFPKQPPQQVANLQVLEKAQFAGCLLNAVAIRKAGLPLKEFFIYYDDWEFTSRLIKKGFTGLFVENLFVWHNADEIRQSQPYLNRRKQDIWKHFYGIRNELYILRKRNFVTFIRPFLYNLFYIPFLILTKRKEDKFYVAFNWVKWTLKSIFLKTYVGYPDGA